MNIIENIIENITNKAPDIIREAAKSRLGVVSFIALLLAILALAFFWDADVSVRIAIFLFILLSAAFLLGAVLRVARPVPGNGDNLKHGDKKISILYVEDTETEAQEYKPLLDEHFGAECVTHAKTARKALEELRKPDLPDVLVTDLFLEPGPDYKVPESRKNSPRIGSKFDFGADVCAVALQRKIPVVALSTVPERNSVREPIDKARREYGGFVTHIRKGSLTGEKLELISHIRKASSIPPEITVLTEHLENLLGRWPDATGPTEQLSTLHDIQMDLENASKPAIEAIQLTQVYQRLQYLLVSHLPNSDEEQESVDQMKRLFP